MKSLTLQVTSLPDREKPVCEIWFGNDQVAEVSNENEDTVLIEIFPAPTGEGWCFNLDTLQAILIEAKNNMRKA